RGWCSCSAAWPRARCSPSGPRSCWKPGSTTCRRPTSRRSRPRRPPSRSSRCSRAWRRRCGRRARTQWTCCGRCSGATRQPSEPFQLLRLELDAEVLEQAHHCGPWRLSSAAGLVVAQGHIEGAGRGRHVHHEHWIPCCLGVCPIEALAATLPQRGDPGRLDGHRGPHQAKAFNPCFLATCSSLSAIPLGRFAPDSHFATVLSVVLRYLANTGWLTRSRSL